MHKLMCVMNVGENGVATIILAGFLISAYEVSEHFVLCLCMGYSSNVYIIICTYEHSGILFV